MKTFKNKNLFTCIKMVLNKNQKILIGGGIVTLVVVGLIWFVMKNESKSKSKSKSTAHPSVIFTAGGKNSVTSGVILSSGDYLLPGSSLNTSSIISTSPTGIISTSPNALSLSLSSAGKLCLINTINPYTLCAPKVNSPGAAVIMNSSGNLVLIDKNGNILWQTNTHSPGAFLKLQEDGNLVIYKANASGSISDSADAIWAQANLSSLNTFVSS